MDQIEHVGERRDPIVDRSGKTGHAQVTKSVPNRSNRRTPTQDGRALRRYRRRWKIERLFAWFHNSRRIVTRWERDPDNFLGMIHLASAVILLRAFMR